MRQRLSSEPDRYRGRRRVATPPRSRYAVVGAAAFVGAGVVAFGAANLPDHKDVNPAVLHDLAAAKDTGDDIAARNSDAQRADRSARGAAKAAAPLSDEEAQAQAWMLPLNEYQFTAGYGMRFGELHAGIDLAAPEGQPYTAVHGGTVTQAGYYGAYGYAVTVDAGDGVEMIYAHSRRVAVKQGDVVKAGQILGEVGNTGASYGPHLHLEIHVDNEPTDPIPLLREHGVDVKLKIESVYGLPAAG